MKLKPLTEKETAELLVLLRKLWREDSGADEIIKRIAKNLFLQVINTFDDR